MNKLAGTHSVAYLSNQATAAAWDALVVGWLADDAPSVRVEIELVHIVQPFGPVVATECVQAAGAGAQYQTVSWKRCTATAAATSTQRTFHRMHTSGSSVGSEASQLWELVTTCTCLQYDTTACTHVRAISTGVQRHTQRAHRGGTRKSRSCGGRRRSHQTCTLTCHDVPTTGSCECLGWCQQHPRQTNTGCLYTATTFALITHATW